MNKVGREAWPECEKKPVSGCNGFYGGEWKMTMFCEIGFFGLLNGLYHGVILGISEADMGHIECWNGPYRSTVKRISNCRKMQMADCQCNTQPSQNSWICGRRDGCSKKRAYFRVTVNIYSFSNTWFCINIHNRFCQYCIIVIGIVCRGGEYSCVSVYSSVSWQAEGCCFALGWFLYGLW